MAEGLARDSEEIEVHEGQPASVDLRLQRGAVVVGDIRGLSTSELESCMVWVEEGGRAGASADGAFRIDGVPSGEHQVVAIETVTRRTRSAGVVVPESGESERVVIDFAAGLAVFGQVLRGGAGASGLAVSVHGVACVILRRNGQRSRRRVADRRVWRPASTRSRFARGQVTVIAGDHVLLETDTELDLHVPSGSLGGRVLEADTRRPIAGAAVTVVGSSIPPTRRGATSDDTGAFEIPELGDGEYTVRAEAPGRTPAQKPVTLSGSVAGEVELLLKSDAATVLVVRESDGSSATGIWILTLGGGSIGPAVSVSCTAGGRCAVDDLPQGRWTMLVRGQGMALVVVDVPKDEVVVQLRKKGGLTIKAPADESGAAWQVRVSDAATGIVLPVHPYSNPAGGEWVPVRSPGLAWGSPRAGGGSKATHRTDELSVTEVAFRAVAT